VGCFSAKRAQWEPTKVTDRTRGRSTYRLVDSRAPPTPEDLRVDARNSVRLAEIARSGRAKAMLLHAANEFLNKAADLEAAAYCAD
jgi:hypothetical protein